MKKIGVLISGRGSNLRALLKACEDPTYPAEIVMVITDNVYAHGLDYALFTGIQTRVFPLKNFTDSEVCDAAMTTALESAGVEIVCLAGFMRVLTKDFVEHWMGRMINIHPSLLPKYPGLDTHTRALQAGEKIHGCTVHYVDLKVDSGCIVDRAEVPVLSDDTEETLAARVLEAEHKLYPPSLRKVIADIAWAEWLQNYREEHGWPDVKTYLNPGKPSKYWLEEARKCHK